MDDVRGWEAGRLQRGGREEGRGFLEVSSRLSIVERLPVGATARAGTGEQRSVVASEPTSRQGQARAGDRCHDATMQSCQLDGGALQEYFALLDRGMDAQE